MFKSLLPNNATAAERQIEEVLANKIARLDASLIKKIHSPAECPAVILPWLAYARHVETWQENWSLATKRAAVAESFFYHKNKGTKAVVVSALAKLGIPCALFERRDIGAIPKSRFRVVVYSETSAAQLNRLHRLIQMTKKLTAHYEIEKAMPNLTITAAPIGQLFFINEKFDYTSYDSYPVTPLTLP